MNQEELRLHRCCFTGHRPDKMGLGEKEIKPLLEKTIDEAIADGYVTFITGMAMGTDIWAAEIVLERKKTNKELHLICALPHPNFESRRSMTEKMRFNKIIKNADLVKEINNHYFTGFYQVRNEWMVDRSNLVITVFNGQKSGTKNTDDYAKRKGVRVVNVLNSLKNRFCGRIATAVKGVVRQNFLRLCVMFQSINGKEKEPTD